MNIINSWDDVSLSKFNDMNTARALSDDDTDYIVRLIAILSDTPYQEVLDMDYREIEKMAANLRFIKDAPKERTVKKSYTLGGKKYKTCMNLTDITTAQYIDFQQTAPNADEDMPSLLAIILIPDGYKYNSGYNLEEVKADIEKYLSIRDIISLSAFFFTLFQISIKRAQAKLKKMTKKAEKEAKTQEQKEAVMNLQKIAKDIDSLLS